MNAPTDGRPQTRRRADVGGRPRPTAIRWRRDVFRAAGLGAPASDWTTADFQAASLTPSAEG